MTIEAVAFLIGGILIGTAIVGGGFEIKEIKMPRVGAGVRIVSLIAGSGFLLLALSMWGVNHPELLAEQVPANAFAPPVDTTAVQPQVEDRSVAVETSEAASPAPEEQTWTQDAPAAAFTGFSGENQLVWTVEDITYYGAATFNGSSGFLRVAFVYPETKEEVQVDQDLILRENEGVFWYTGANPRDASTGEPFDETEYAPDHLRIVADGHGGWTLDQVCDTRACWPLSIQ